MISASGLKGNLKLTKLTFYISSSNVNSGQGNLNLQECKKMISQAPALQSLTLSIDWCDHPRGLNVIIRTLLSTHQIHLKCFILHVSCEVDALSQECLHGTLDEFLKGFVGLEKLILRGDCAWKLPSTSAIINHGETLQCLMINRPSTAEILPAELEPKLGCIAEKLQTMCRSCPHLRYLSIDIDLVAHSNELVSSVASPFVEIETS